VRMLLEYLERHEQHMVQTLGRFEHESHARLLNGWLEYSPGLRCRQCHRDLSAVRTVEHR
jgi:hypothetical protein